uniref:60S ribosomal protein L33-B n=1 Tax=Arundo donax TaxID=35708 RepID=A0A0A9EDQ8_ARUDO
MICSMFIRDLLRLLSITYGIYIVHYILITLDVCMLLATTCVVTMCTGYGGSYF